MRRFPNFLDNKDEGSSEPKKSRFIGKLISAKKQRDLEKIMRDDRKQEKERIAEEDKYKDKETFVTSGYNKRKEETKSMRQKIEYDDRVNDATSIQGQKMWRSNFGKLIFDQLDKRHSEDDSHKEEAEVDHNRHSNGGGSYKEVEPKRHSGSYKEAADHKRHFDSYKRRSKDVGSYKRRSEDVGSEFDDSYKKKEREIFQHRNSQAQIEEARERYLLRRNAGIIKP